MDEIEQQVDRVIEAARAAGSLVLHGMDRKVFCYAKDVPQVLQTILALWPLWAILVALLILGEVGRQIGWIGSRGAKHRRRAVDDTDDDYDIELDSGAWTSRSSGTVTFPYAMKPELLTACERDFLKALERAVVGRSTIFAQVNLASLVEVRTRSKSEQQAAYNRICRKHVDFVLCDMEHNARPILVIELDDRTHDLSIRRVRDRFIDAALGAAKLPILHFPAAAVYEPNEIEAAIRQALNQPAKPDARNETMVQKANLKRELAELREQRPR
jgi:very-short-patch-repair endonuclease